MILTNMYEKPEEVILVLKGTEAGKTVEECVAEAILEGIDAAGSISSWALHFASMHHPFSTMQRLREMKKEFQKWWLADLGNRVMLGQSFIPGPDDYAFRFVKSEMRYYFSPHFVRWLRHEYIEKKQQEPADVPAD